MNLEKTAKAESAMMDQAKTLRELMARSMRIAQESSHAQSDLLVANLPEISDVNLETPPPTARMVVLMGGRAGVGTTSLARELAVVLAESGQSSAVRTPLELSHFETQAESDWVVVDGGIDFTDELAELWADADAVTLVTTTDAASVTGSYRLMKSAVLRGLSLNGLNVVVNQVANQHEAERTGRRLKRCCKQFLGHCHRDPEWFAFDSNWVERHPSGKENIQNCDSVGGTFWAPINRDVKTWADRVLFGSQTEVGS